MGPLLGERIVGDRRIHGTANEECIKGTAKGTFSADDEINGTRVIGFIIWIAINLISIVKAAQGTLTLTQALRQATSAETARGAGNLEDMMYTKETRNGSRMSSVGVDITITVFRFRKCASDITPGAMGAEDMMKGIISQIMIVRSATVKVDSGSVKPPRIVTTLFDGYAEYRHNMSETADGQLTTKTRETAKTARAADAGRLREASGAGARAMRLTMTPFVLTAGVATQPQDKAVGTLATKTETLDNVMTMISECTLTNAPPNDSRSVKGAPSLNGGVVGLCRESS